MGYFQDIFQANAHNMQKLVEGFVKPGESIRAGMQAESSSSCHAAQEQTRIFPVAIAFALNQQA